VALQPQAGGQHPHRRTGAGRRHAARGRGRRPRGFEPFFTTDAQGTGLGLFLARELAEANHAALAYVPEAGGARFRLSLRGSE
jgi:nitrogen fixation/metabolism regulation signal transduction histidine kinase